MHKYCSNCFQKSFFKLKRSNKLRSRYDCNHCGIEHAECSILGCDAMALASKLGKDGKVEKLEIANFLCAEHNGAIRNFQTVNERISSLELYEKLMKRRSRNWKSIAIKTGSVVVVAALTFFTAGQAAPLIAAKAGSLGLLGAAGTGTAIVTLKGAALASASLAAIGGSVAGGIAIITAVGAAFGAWKGGALAQGYFGDVHPFKIRRVKNGDSSKPAIIFINGFMSELEQNRSEWLNLVKQKYPDRIAYEVEWETKKLKDWYRILKSPTAFLKFVAKKSPKRGLFAFISGGADLADSPFHQAMYKAQVTGLLLADAIARTPVEQQFSIMGHSLGARVAYYSLLALAQSEGYKNGLNRVHEVHFFGGAVGANEKELKNINRLCIRQINNYYSMNDLVLKHLYKGATVLMSEPIGRSSIIGVKNVKNHDVTSLVHGHRDYIIHADQYLYVRKYQTKGSRAASVKKSSVSRSDKIKKSAA